MTIAQLERRVSKLERLVDELSQRSATKPLGGWRKSLGRFANDPVFDEIVRLGREYRESLRPKSPKARKRRNVHH
jgi:hypothetical protein